MRGPGYLVDPERVESPPCASAGHPVVPLLPMVACRWSLITRMRGACTVRTLRHVLTEVWGRRDYLARVWPLMVGGRESV